MTTIVMILELMIKGYPIFHGKKKLYVFSFFLLFFNGKVTSVVLLSSIVNRHIYPHIRKKEIPNWLIFIVGYCNRESIVASSISFVCIVFLFLSHITVYTIASHQIWQANTSDGDMKRKMSFNTTISDSAQISWWHRQ